MLFNITTQEEAYACLSRLLALNEKGLWDNWRSCDYDEDKFINENLKSINTWDIARTEFIVKHVTSSCNEAKDIQDHGLLYLPDVLRIESQLKRMLVSFGIVIDVDNKKLLCRDNEYELDYEILTEQPWTMPFRSDLIQISRSLYRDYLSTMLFCENPWMYGIGLYRHPEFMEYLWKIEPICRQAIKWWDEHSKGYLITAKVPFRNIAFMTFGYNSQSNFEEDIPNGLIQAKYKLLRDAIYAGLEKGPSDRYLFIKQGERIDKTDILSIKAKDNE